MERKLLDPVRAALRKAGFENLRQTYSTHRLALGGNKGEIRVFVQFTDGLEQAFGSQPNPKVPNPRQIAARPHLGPAKRGSQFFSGAGAATVKAVSPKGPTAKPLG